MTEQRNWKHLLSPQHVDNIRSESYLALLHKYFDIAAHRVEQAAGVPLCIEHCGRCCTSNSVLSYGVEAEAAASWLYSNGTLIPRVVAACEQWLTQQGNWTYASSITQAGWKSLEPEYLRALTTPCPLMDADKRCLIHPVRPLVCRAYGVTRLPGAECPRPLGIGESNGQKLTFDSRDRNLPIQALMDEMVDVTEDLRYKRWGFFYTMLFERLAASRLAGLIDDGKVPTVKGMVMWGASRLMLWQTQLDEEWKNTEADKSIDTQAYLKDDDKGIPHLTFRVGRDGKVKRA